MDRGVIRFYDFSPPESGFLEDVLTGLARSPKELPAKYFYDAQGSALFDAICDLPEYYLTRAELHLMERHGTDIAAFIGPAAELVEFGSGSGRKTRILIEAARPLLYSPVDIARAQLESASREVAGLFPWLNIAAICADFARPLTLPEWKGLATRRRVIYFPGSTIGNFTREETAAFLQAVRRLAGTGGAAVIGVDLKKDPALLHAAYNDAQGVTARFNLNILAHINRRLGSDFHLQGFRHVAFYDEAQGRIEMHLRSVRRQEVSVAQRRFAFAEGELMRTEISCKYAAEEFQALARQAGLRPARVWFDDDRLFSVHGLVAE
ncbi:MAG: L-histidine N(alpha)-methyltransferase [Pseudomonadota bacterium]|jgi:dimethylhistidine N-methyltransferase